jgi:hypothetical protein
MSILEAYTAEVAAVESLLADAAPTSFRAECLRSAVEIMRGRLAELQNPGRSCPVPFAGMVTRSATDRGECPFSSVGSDGLPSSWVTVY